MTATELVDEGVASLCAILRTVAGMLVDAQDDLERATGRSLSPRAWMPALDDLHLALTEFAALTGGLGEDLAESDGAATSSHDPVDGPRAVEPLAVAAQLISAAAMFAATAHQAAGR